MGDSNGTDGAGVEGDADIAKEAAANTGSSSDGAPDAGSSIDATTTADGLDGRITDASSSIDANDGASSASDGAVDGTTIDTGVGAIVINEVASSGAFDFIELYNQGGAPIDISGWYISDSDPDAAGHTYTFPSGTLVTSHGFIFVADSVDAGGGLMTFSLGSDDAAILRDRQGNLINQVVWTTHRTPSASRCPDGTGAFTNGTPESPGAANICTDQ